MFTVESIDKLDFRFSVKARKFYKKLENQINPRNALKKKFTKEVNINTKAVAIDEDKRFDFGDHKEEFFEILKTYYLINGTEAV